MPQEGFAHTIPVFKRAKIVDALDRAVTVAGIITATMMTVDALDRAATVAGIITAMTVDALDSAVTVAGIITATMMTVDALDRAATVAGIITATMMNMIRSVLVTTKRLLSLSDFGTRASVLPVHNYTGPPYCYYLLWVASRSVRFQQNRPSVPS
jgi:hypothetical protein